MVIPVFITAFIDNFFDCEKLDLWKKQLKTALKLLKLSIGH